MSQTRSYTSLVVVGIISLFLIQLPGQNKLQTLVLNPQPSRIKGISIDVKESSLPKKITSVPAPEISAQSSIVIDTLSGSTLHETNPDQQRMPASTTKIMTAIIVLENYDLQDVVEIENENFSIGNKSYLISKEKITVENLLKALLINSGNDAALALAQHHPKGYEAFLDAMNQKAKDIHLSNSNFTNVSGLDQPNHYMSARDLGILTRYAIQNQNFKNIISTKKIIVSSVDGGVDHLLENTNELLGRVDGLFGVKTGWTLKAGECLVTATTRNDKTIITVVLGSKNRFEESRQLIEWAFENHQWVPFPIEI